MASTVKSRSLFDATILKQAIVDSFRKLTFQRQVRKKCVMASVTRYSATPVRGSVRMLAITWCRSTP